MDGCLSFHKRTGHLRTLLFPASGTEIAEDTGPRSHRRDCENIRQAPAHFDAAAVCMRTEDMHGSVLISADLQQHAAWLHKFVELGFDGIYLHHVGTEPQAFIEAFGAHVLPQLKPSGGRAQD